MIKRMTLLISIVILIAAQAYADETTDETTEMLFSSHCYIALLFIMC
jgi:hypothetical protein